MTLRPAQPPDVVAMAGILSGWIDETPWLPRIHTIEQDRAFVRRALPQAVVWEQNEVVGFLVRDGAEVECLYVSPGFRGQGVGRRLLDHAKAGSPVLNLWTFAANTGARRFYAREGFHEVAQTDGAENAERLPDVRLVWSDTGGMR